MSASARFTRLARDTARISGRPITFILAAGVILVWLVSGPIFHYSDTWQLVINTTTTIITFLMVFLIQNTQNRDTEALQVKLDELLRAHTGAHNALMDLEELEERELDSIRKSYVRLAAEARKQLREGGRDVGAPEVS
jgi:low affinity Fe/Cu permease